jgi:hypothetical protein
MTIGELKAHLATYADYQDSEPVKIRGFSDQGLITGIADTTAVSLPDGIDIVITHLTFTPKTR